MDIVNAFREFDWVSNRRIPTVLLAAVLAGKEVTYQNAANLVLVRSARYEGVQQYQFCIATYGDDQDRLIRLGLHRFKRGSVYYDLTGARVGEEWVITNYQGANGMPVSRPYYGWFPKRPERVGETRDFKPAASHAFAWT